MVKTPRRLHSDDELLTRLFAAIGMAECNAFERYGLAVELEDIRAGCSKLNELPVAGGTHRKLLKKFRANTAKRRALRKQLAPVLDAIAMAALRRRNPDADEAALRAALSDLGRIDPADAEDDEDRDIAFLIDQSGDYRKRQVRKLAVEPFLRWLDNHGVVAHPKRLPRSAMMRAWFDWLGIAPRLRPSDAGIRTIARELHSQCKPSRSAKRARKTVRKR